jgi:protein-tyrosine phosphatase
VIRHVLVVCVGNICRSPVGEAALREALPGLTVASAGLDAMVGAGADPTMSAVAARHGLSLEGHIARQFTREIGEAHDLILVMEPRHRRDIGRMAPQLEGRCMLFDHWCGASGIADPYRHPSAVHDAVFMQITQSSQAWAKRLHLNISGNRCE